MPSTDSPLRPDQPLGQLASSHAGASRVFHRHGLDFCCGGATSLAEACASARLDVADVLDELRVELAQSLPGPAWTDRPLGELIDHLLADAGDEAAVAGAAAPRHVRLPRRAEFVSRAAMVRSAV